MKKIEENNKAEEENETLDEVLKANKTMHEDIQREKQEVKMDDIMTINEKKKKNKIFKANKQKEKVNKKFQIIEDEDNIS